MDRLPYGLDRLFLVADMVMAARSNDRAPYGHCVLTAQGGRLSAQAFHRGGGWPRRRPYQTVLA